ncbi:MAG: transglycosylase SLT domain-containing protein [Acidobacteria bacterium]|nr:transglycosylase SLT domain-containing protein [Acidobacteriota bacterium]
MFRYLLACLMIAAAILAAGVYFFREYWEHRFDPLIEQQARIYRIDEKLVWSLIYEETYFRSGAKGDAEEVGLMQVTPLVAREWAKETGLTELQRQAAEDVEGLLSDPKRNLQVGCWYYEKLRERYRGRPAETAMTLAAYNAGPSRVEEWTREVDAASITETQFIERIGIASTRAYVSSILERYRASTPNRPK